MLQNIVKIALRHLFKQKLNSLINIFGFALSIAAAILISSYVYFELSYDKYHKNVNHIYRVFSKVVFSNGTTEDIPAALGELAPLMREQIPEVEEVVRLIGRDPQIEFNNKIFSDHDFFWTDSSFFDVFTFKTIQGNPRTALKESNTLVFSATMAKKVFGTEFVLNKMVKLNGETFKVLAVVEDTPMNSHFYFDILGSFSSVCNAKRDITKEDGMSFYTYILCSKTAGKEAVEAKINQLNKSLVAQRLGAYGIEANIILQPLRDIHLYSQTKFELEANGNSNNVYIFSFLAFFIILIAIINFVNLITANSETRAKEIGLRKVMGAFRISLFRQFVGESVLITFGAFLIALGMTELFIDSFRELMHSPIIIPYHANMGILIYMIIAILILGVLSGIYPATYLSGFTPAKVLKGTRSSGRKNALLRKTLVVFQFTIAIFLMINLALLYQQLNYLKNKNLGFDKDQVMVVSDYSSQIQSSYASLKAELLKSPYIESVTTSHSVPGKGRSLQVAYMYGEDPNTAVLLNENRTEYDYLKTYGIELIAGRDFSDKMGSEKQSFILNETAAKALGIADDPIGKNIVIVDRKGKVIGVVKDFHFKSLHEKIGNLAFTMYSNRFSYISIKLNTKDIHQTIAYIQSVFDTIDPNNTFQYFFIDQNFNQMYQAEDRINKLISYGAMLAIIISVLGLFALTSFSIQQKVQEIGIRKVMGASVKQILALFITDQTKWVVLAAILAFPPAYYSMSRWLENFVYHIQIRYWMFLFGSIIALFVAIATVYFVSWRAARTNPADSLKHE